MLLQVILENLLVFVYEVKRMVTIEQKLTLFSKLLNQEIKEETQKEQEALDKEYERIIAENKYLIDKQAEQMVEHAKKRAETQKVELISKSRLSSKKEYLMTIEEIIESFMKDVKERIAAFVKTEAYKKYVEKLAEDVSELKGSQNKLIVEVTAEDYKRKAFIEAALLKAGLPEEKIAFEVSKEEILGGFIIKDTILDTKIDESISTLLEESKDRIVELVTSAIEEGGEARD